MQYLIYLSVRRYNSVNSFSTTYPVVFQMPQFMPHSMCPVHACCSGVLSLHLSNRALELWDTSAMKMLKERALCWSNANSSGWLRILDVAHAAVDWSCSFAGDCWFTIELIICYICTQVFNIVISLSSTSHYLVFVSLLQFIYIYLPWYLNLTLSIFNKMLLLHSALLQILWYVTQ